MHSTFSRLRQSVAFLVCLLAPCAAQGQCEPQWLPGQGAPGPNARVLDTVMWDPDGPGGQAAALIAAGAFTHAEVSQVNYVATWDGENWSAVGSGTNQPVHALAILANGDLIAAGAFTSAGGVAANRIARWDGKVWSPLGLGLDGAVWALEVMPNGDLIAAGSFTSAGGVAASKVARWDGMAWSSIGSGMNANVLALTVLDNGDLVAGGEFTTADGHGANRIARWDGVEWLPLHDGLSGDSECEVSALCVLPDGDLVAGGRFATAAGVAANNIARWNGAAWSSLGTGVEGAFVSAQVMSLAVLPSGELLVGGSFTSAGGVEARSIATWNDEKWSSIGGGIIGDVFSLTIVADGFLAGGYITRAGDVGVYSLARWNGTSWSGFGSGINGPVYSFTTLPHGDLVMGGSFTHVGGVSANAVARWDGTSWSAFGSGMSGVHPYVLAMAGMPNGDVVAGGINLSPDENASYIQLWNGSTWSAVGQLSNEVDALAVLPDKTLVAGGFFTFADGVRVNCIARWDGVAWSPLGSGMTIDGSPPPYPAVYAIVVLPNGDIVAGGYFSRAGGTSARNIARWNGSQWLPMGMGVRYRVMSLAVLPNGDVVATGEFRFSDGTSSSVARWNGTSWIPMGTDEEIGGNLYALTALPNGNVVAGGSFWGPFQDIALWDGSDWSPMGLGMDATVWALGVLSNGDVVAGGGFQRAGDELSRYFARYTFDCCPADTDQDGYLTGIDFDLFVYAFEDGEIEADFDGDGFVNGLDFDLFVYAYEVGC